MRPAWIALLFAGCSFTPPDLTGPPGDGAVPTDGSGGAIDAPGPADAPMCDDDDHDTICNTLDKCPGNDDRLDKDTDAIPDGCDDWPCGLKPNDPGDPMADADASTGRSWGAGLISIGDSRRVVANPGSTFGVGFAWQFAVQCPGSFCNAQLEYGYNATRLGCIYDGPVTSNFAKSGVLLSQLSAPTAPGLYEIKLNASRRPDCGGGPQWYSATPGAASTIAIVCVPPP